MNTVIISGNLTRDVETRFTQSGTAIGSFGIACNRKWKDQSGELKEEVTFVDVSVWGKQAETVAQYFRKGSKILISGRLKLDQWDDKKTGQKRSKLGVVLESFEFIGGKREETEKLERPDAGDIPSAPKATSEAEDDQIPF